jgi:alpha-glucosidase
MFTTYAQNKTASTPVQIQSPDKEITFTLSALGGTLQYSINYKNAPVINASRLGLVVNGKLSGENSSTGKVEKYKINDKYAYRGVHSTAINKCNGAKINITSIQSPFILDVRVFNDGVAFRYVVNNSGAATIEKDTTAFVIPAGSMVWSQNNTKYYEGRYGKKSIDSFKQNDLAGPPVTIELPNNSGFAAITEGGLTDFAGMSLRADGKRGFNANLSGATKKNGNIETPWRIIEIGKDLNTLVNCDIIANVSPAYDRSLFPQGYNTDWIKPGRSVWSWLAVNRSVTLSNMKKFSDLAAQLGFEYNLVDEGWGNWKDTARNLDHWAMMKELVDYSATKGVKVWVWKAYPDRGGIPGIKDAEKRKEFFKKCKDIGIAGLKVDFFDSENQEIINFYQAALKDAAEYHLMMNFHGANKPTGEARTWPNEMTREAVRGMENQPPWAPGNTTYPFTRYLVGHADYTPIHFGNRMGEVSWAHHIASLVIFTSPLLCVGADPQSMLDNPAKEMIQSVPPTWDETIVLPPSKISELALYARRKGTTWFLAAMNGVHESKTITVDLSFLKKGSYTLSSMKDDKGKQAGALLESTVVSSKTPFTFTLNPEGGFVGRFEKK